MTKFKLADVNKEPQSEPIAQQEPAVRLTRWMVGTYIDPMTNEWMLAQIKFDPITKQTGELVTERVTGDYEVMKERLAVKEAILNLFSRENAND